MIFGAALEFQRRVHQGPAPAVAKAGTSPRSPFDAVTAWTTLAAPMCGTNGAVKPKWKRADSRISASPADRSACTANGACTKVKAPDDNAPDAFGGVEREGAVMTLDQPPHHVRFARRAKRRSGLFGFLTAMNRQ